MTEKRKTLSVAQGVGGIVLILCGLVVAVDGLVDRGIKGMGIGVFLKVTGAIALGVVALSRARMGD